MTAVITGSTKGIGASISEYFAKEGFDLVICSRNNKDLIAFKEKLESSYKITVHTLEVDLSKKEDILKLCSYINKLQSSIEVLVNNAGSYIPGGVLTEEEGALEFMINTNLYSAYHLTRGIVHKMSTTGKAYIFNICSIAGLQAYHNGGAYSISKFALNGFTKNLREELKEKNIRVSAVHPGATMSNSWADSGIAEDRIMEANDIAIAIWSAYSMSTQAVVEDIILRPQLGDL
ncbi:MAG: SDR family NAD(P)-dependent oxidoreductase [Saprospiraceae bacterium]|nr:SDR family NAD(P)-dependent oxidoreductase [Saprospiraceae bacterium]